MKPVAQENYLIRKDPPKQNKNRNGRGPSFRELLFLLAVGVILLLLCVCVWMPRLFALKDVFAGSACVPEGDAVQNGNSSPVGHAYLEAPFLCQLDSWPTGCESVSAVMALQYYGEDITVDEFIDFYLPTGRVPYLGSDGMLYGSDPRECFLGDPRSDSGWGCWSPVIARALSDYCGGKYTVLSEDGVPLRTLCETYLEQGVPVILWATIDMAPAFPSETWRIEGTQEDFTWIYPLHCLLLTGYDEEYYYFNDPMKREPVSYGLEETETAYAAMGYQAVVLLPN